MKLSNQHSRSYIKAQPLAALQQEFVTHATRGTLSDAVKAQLISRLEKTIPSEKKFFFEQEQRKIAQALQGDFSPHLPSINSPESSLLWAITLANRAQKSELPSLYDTKLWRQFASADGVAQSEKETLARHMAILGVNSQTKIQWGEMGSSFYFNPQENRVNLDLIISLGVGFDISRAVSFHEMGHAILTKGFGEKIEAFDAQIKALLEKSEKGSLSKDEYATLQKLGAERNYRFKFADEAENNVVDRWTVNQGRSIREDHALARNTAEATIVDGLIGDSENVPDAAKGSAQHRLQNVKKAIRYSFFRNNGYFEDSEQGWREIGVDSDLIKSTDGTTGMEALAQLKELCGGAQGVENLQPNGLHMLSGQAAYAQAIEDFSAKRNERIEEIYEQFVEPIVQELLQQKQEQLEQQMQQNSQQGESKPEEGKGSGQGEGKPQEGKGSEQGEGKPQEGQGSGQGEGKPQEGQGSGQGEGKPEEGKGSGEGEGKPQEGQGSGQGEGKPEQGQGSGQGEGKPKPIQVEGVGEMPGVEAPPETPAEARERLRPKPKTSSDGKKIDEGQTIEELEAARRQRIDAQGQEAGEAGKGSRSARQVGDQGFRPAAGAGVSNVESAPKVGDWSDYQGMVAEFGAAIHQQRSLIEQLRARQIAHHKKHAPELSLLPEDGHMGRLDPNAHKALLQKMARREAVVEDDARRFRTDTQKPTPGDMDVVLLIDGSGSMHSQNSSWPFSPILAGMHTGCIMNEACKNPNPKKPSQVNFYMGLWGNAEPLMLVKPKDDAQQIGKRIAGVQQSQGWGTSLAPSIRHATAQLAEATSRQRGRSNKIGYTHIIVVSDGGISDANASLKTIQALLNNCPMSSVDFVVIENGKTQMDALGKKLEAEFPNRFRNHHFNNPAQVEEGVGDLLLGRIQDTPTTPTIDAHRKGGMLSRAAQEMRR